MFANIFCSIWNIFCSWFHATKKKSNNNKGSFETFEHSLRSKTYHCLILMFPYITQPDIIFMIFYLTIRSNPVIMKKSFKLPLFFERLIWHWKFHHFEIKGQVNDWYFRPASYYGLSKIGLDLKQGQGTGQPLLWPGHWRVWHHCAERFGLDQKVFLTYWKKK